MPAIRYSRCCSLWWGLIEVLAADTSVSAKLAVSGDESCAHANGMHVVSSSVVSNTTLGMNLACQRAASWRKRAWRGTRRELWRSKSAARNRHADCVPRAARRSDVCKEERACNHDGIAISCASAPRSTGTCWCTWRRRWRHQGGSSCPLMLPRTMSLRPSLQTIQAADALEGEDRRKGAARARDEVRARRRRRGPDSAVLGLERSDGQRTDSAEAARAHLRRPPPR